MMGKINYYIKRASLETIYHNYWIFHHFDYCHDDRQLLDYKCTVYRSE